MVPEGLHPLWPQRYGNGQGKHGPTNRKMAGHVFIYTQEAGGGEGRTGSRGEAINLYSLIALMYLLQQSCTSLKFHNLLGSTKPQTKCSNTGTCGGCAHSDSQGVCVVAVSSVAKPF